MPDPNYVLGNTIEVELDGDPLYIQQSNIRESGEVIDCTNNVVKFYEFEVGVIEYSADFTAVIPVAAASAFKTANVSFPAVVGYDPGPKLTGTVKITTRSIAGGARGAATVNGTLVFNGAVVST